MRDYYFFAFAYVILFLMYIVIYYRNVFIMRQCVFFFYLLHLFTYKPSCLRNAITKYIKRITLKYLYINIK